VLVAVGRTRYAQNQVKLSVVVAAEVENGRTNWQTITYIPFAAAYANYTHLCAADHSSNRWGTRFALTLGQQEVNRLDEHGSYLTYSLSWNGTLDNPFLWNYDPDRQRFGELFPLRDGGYFYRGPRPASSLAIYPAASDGVRAISTVE
jgi:hypothetical protein